MRASSRIRKSPRSTSPIFGLAGGGGAAVIAAVSAKWEKITGQIIREGYGLSETSPVLSFNPMYLTEFSGTTGVPMPSTDIKLLDENDRDVAIGEPGEICAKGPQIMSGYWEKPEANALAFTADGYFRTGDVGVFDAKGFLKIVDRKKDMIIVSGFNVYPNEVEAIATGCPGVLECACIGVADEKTGEAVKLFVVKAAECDADDTRPDRALPQGNDRLQDPEDRRIPRRAAEVERRQDPAPRIARAGVGRDITVKLQPGPETPRAHRSDWRDRSGRDGILLSRVGRPSRRFGKADGVDHRARRCPGTV